MIPPIVHVASGREWRGGQRQVWLLARALGGMGVEQVVVTGSGTELARRLEKEGVPLRPVSWRAGLDPRVLPALLGQLRRRRAILHAHDAHALTLAGASATLTGCPLVVTRRVTFPLRNRFFWRRAHRVIAISRAVRSALVADGLRPERLVVIHSAVDLQQLPHAPDPEIRRSFHLPEKGQLAVSLGALTPDKAQSVLVAAAALLVRDLPDLHWVIVGEGPLRRDLQRLIAQLGLQDRFHLIGDLDNPHSILGAADVFVLSSAAEGLGSSILAAMALDVPVVATRVGGVPDLLETGGGLMVGSGNVGDFAAAVLRVLTEFELRQELTRVARRGLGKFSVGAMAEQVLGVYRSCAHSLGGS